ncbi:site-specific DNA-methyltransferase [Tannerella sp.]|uniref:site-specific DNA-methyltransferase n=1 Tax=Tannerella sp. TaxID=2382127 RepID=UPI0026DC28DA|nr:DNA methyltransferase [Tannerella sp.]MDO4704169.1 DNA methyltransferase [Tannerella sp.]
MNKKELYNKILQLNGLTNEEKSELLGLLRKQKKYGLVWEDKPENVEERLREELPVLVEDTSKAIISTEADAPNHILIEGDNLEALTALSYTHEGKIDVIYIDPPYNRGKNDFRYNDDYIDEDNPFKHSLWLSFMSKRLKIAKQLLSPHGIIIAHIDEHEFDTFNLVLAEIFGSKNNLGQIIWNKMNPKGDAHAVSYMHEYILIYCKSKDSFLELEDTFIRPKCNAQKMLTKANRLFSQLGKDSVPSEILDILKVYGFKKEEAKPFIVHYDLKLINSEFQKWINRSDFSKGEKAYKYIHPNGRVFRTVSMAWPNKECAPKEYWTPLIHPILGTECPIPSKGWRFPPLSFERLLGKQEPLIINNDMVIKGEVVFTRKRNEQLNIPERIYWLDENMDENVPSIYEDGSSDENLLSDLNISFDYPKTVSIGKYLISTIYPSASTILDFFAGSGTALHAVLEQNAIDGKHRSFIGVTNNQNNICEEVTYSRLFKVINGYTTPKGEEVPGLKGNTLRYYRTSFVGRSRTMKNMRQLMSLSTDMLCIKEDLYTEQPKFGEQPTYKNVFRYFDNGRKRMMIIYREEAVQQLVELIQKTDYEGKMRIYVFSPSEDPWEGEFEEVQDKVQLCALPQAIYNAYRRLLPKKKDEFVSSDETKATGQANVTDGVLNFDNEEELQ